MEDCLLPCYNAIFSAREPSTNFAICEIVRNSVKVYDFVRSRPKSYEHQHRFSLRVVRRSCDIDLSKEDAASDRMWPMLLNTDHESHQANKEVIASSDGQSPNSRTQMSISSHCKKRRFPFRGNSISGPRWTRGEEVTNDVPFEGTLSSSLLPALPLVGHGQELCTNNATILGFFLFSPKSQHVLVRCRCLMLVQREQRQ